jgi:hypothetical protein
MLAIGTRINEIGTLVSDGGAFYLRRDVGGRYELELHRTPVDLVEKTRPAYRHISWPRAGKR